MKTMLIGDSFLKVRKEKLEKYLKDTYFHFYKKDRLKHVTNQDKRLPYIKITDDIFSFSIWFKDSKGKEYHIVFDGACFLNEFSIDTITMETKEMNDMEYKAHIECLLSLSNICEGHIMISMNGKPARVKSGSLDNQKHLLKELYEKIPNDEKGEVQAVFDWLMNCSKRTV